MTTRVTLIGDGAVNSSSILNATIKTEDLENNAVTADKLQSGGNDNVRAVGTNHIKNKAITSQKLSDDISTQITNPTLQGLRLDGPFYDNTSQKGNVGDVLTSLGEDNGVMWSSKRLNANLNANPGSTIPFPSTNGPRSVNWSIPSWAKKIDVMFSEVSINFLSINPPAAPEPVPVPGSGPSRPVAPTAQSLPEPTILVQLGSTDSVRTDSYYTALQLQYRAETDTFTTRNSSGFPINYPRFDKGNLSTFTGSLSLLNIHGNTWIGTGTIWGNAVILGTNFDQNVYSIVGKITLLGPIGQIIVTTTNQNTQNIGPTATIFDGGIINVMYE